MHKQFVITVNSFVYNEEAPRVEAVKMKTLKNSRKEKSFARNCEICYETCQFNGQLF